MDRTVDAERPNAQTVLRLVTGTEVGAMIAPVVQVDPLDATMKQHRAIVQIARLAI